MGIRSHRRRNRAWRAGSVLAMVVAALLPPAQAVSADQGSTRAQCTPTDWTEYGSGYITDEISPWFNSAPGIDFNRQMQFRVLSGVYATRTTQACLVQRAVFAGASQYREKQCAGEAPNLACRVTPWLSYGDNAERAGYRFPNRNSGYDPHTGLFNTWETRASAPQPPG